MPFPKSLFYVSARLPIFHQCSDKQRGFHLGECEFIVWYTLLFTLSRSERCNPHQQANSVAGQLAWLAHRSVYFPGFRRAP